MANPTIDEGTAVPAVEWRDKKRHLWLLGLVPPTAVFLATGFVALFNWASDQLDADTTHSHIWFLAFFERQRERERRRSHALRQCFPPFELARGQSGLAERDRTL